jgi:hypothetical protein
MIQDIDDPYRVKEHQLQTFLPYKDFTASAIVLDNRRLNKQVLEAHQIIRTLIGETTGWRNHPAVKMWAGCVPALTEYLITLGKECLHRKIKCELLKQYPVLPYVRNYPIWLGRDDFHASHRSNLLRKYPAWYELFGWIESPHDPYIWPEP